MVLFSVDDFEIEYVLEELNIQGEFLVLMVIISIYVCLGFWRKKSMNPFCSYWVQCHTLNLPDSSLSSQLWVTSDISAFLFVHESIVTQEDIDRKGQ